MADAISLVDAAFRARAAELVVAETGSTVLSSTPAGYARTSGSFLEDGFLVGMEVIPQGFTSTEPALVESVGALTLAVRGGRASSNAASGRSLSVGLPLHRVASNVEYTPARGRQFVEMETVSGGGVMLSAPYQGGTREDTGLFVVRWYGISGTGARGLHACVDALAALFTPGTRLTLSDNSVARVRGDVGAFRSPISNPMVGFALATFTVPWRRYVTNAVIA